MDYIPIKENRDFRRIYSRGKNMVSPVIVCYVLHNRCGTVRVGITTSKRIGNAVKRNRSRRVIRAAFRELLPRIKPGNDFIFVARAKTPYVKSTSVQRAMEQQLHKAGLLQ
ncbi:MAG: ribonuclease P protein component [Oscillospiraceae bacterium]|jgi:ribonuclease P protein component|nr:ribonuclease P protein component [Oscillospiraceae bacterium]